MCCTDGTCSHCQAMREAITPKPPKPKYAEGDELRWAGHSGKFIVSEILQPGARKVGAPSGNTLSSSYSYVGLWVPGTGSAAIARVVSEIVLSSLWSDLPNQENYRMFHGKFQQKVD